MVPPIQERSLLDDFCTRFCRIVEKHCLYIIVSGFVAIASGRVRGTEDIDMIIPKVSLSTFGALHNELLHEDFVCMQADDASEVYEYLIAGDSIRYTEKGNLVPQMEIKFAKDILDTIQLQTRQKLPLTGLNVWFSSIEVNIAFKEEYLKSPKDIEDARYLRIVYKEKIREDEIQRIKRMIRDLRLR